MWLTLYGSIGAGVLVVLLFGLWGARYRVQSRCSEVVVAVKALILAVLWPLVLMCRPSLLRDPSPLWESRREPAFTLPAIRLDGGVPESPPRCGKFIRFAHCGRFESECGELTCLAEDVLLQLPAESMGGGGVLSEEAWLRGWIEARDESVLVAVAVPDTLRRFHFIVEPLLESGRVQVYCRKCQSAVPTRSLLTDHDEAGRPGWQFHRYLCPARHVLLVVEQMHLAVVAGQEQ